MGKVDFLKTFRVQISARLVYISIHDSVLIFEVDCQTDFQCCCCLAALHHQVVDHLDAFLLEEVLLGAYLLEVDHLVVLLVHLDVVLLAFLEVVRPDVVVTTFDSDSRLKVLTYLDFPYLDFPCLDFLG